MSKKRTILLGTFLLGALVVFTWLASSPSGPSYQNRPLQSWLRDLETWDSETNNAALVAFREIGTNAIPDLLRIIESGGPGFQRMIMKINKMQSLVKLPFGRPWDQTAAATRALYAMGTNAKPAMPALTNLLLHTNALICSTKVLAGIESEATPVLLLALTNQDWRIRNATCSGLGWAHSDTGVIVPALIARLQDSQGLVRCAAAFSLGQLRAKQEIAVPALTNAYPNGDSLLRLLVLDSLGKFQSRARQAVPTILSALQDKREDVHNNAAWALKQIDPQADAKAGAE